jgi:carboxylate-amine ligase
VPPLLESWAAFAADLSWGARSGVVSEPRRWWWELRPHVVHGTIEVRVPDVQADPRAMTAIVTTVHALVAHLATQDEAEPLVEAAATWRIAENRWAALRDGVHGTQLDLASGESTPTARRLHGLLDTIEPCARGGLDAARALVERNGADHLRDVGIHRASRWLVDSFRP